MISNARMYSITPTVGAMWRQIFESIAGRASVPLKWLEHGQPAPIEDLWRRDDLGAVFMCGLPYVRSVPRPAIVAAPVPSPDSFRSQPQYWSEFVVRADSGFEVIEDTFGHRMAFTTMGSQSGCLAALFYLMAAGGHGALYKEVIQPRITPLGALTAVIDGLADVAPIDSYSFSLLEKFAPQLTSQVKIVAQTAPTAISPIVASQPVPRSLESEFLEAHKNGVTGALMATLQLERFTSVDPGEYDILMRSFDAATTYWHEHPFASSVHPAFAELATGPLRV
jgi:ABC-type phosphate/phosphonate transport system substrate-binding protein